MAGNVNMTMRTAGKDGLDYYPTPPWVTRALLKKVHVEGPTWEPACGGGHMAEVLREESGWNRPVTASDVHDYGYRGMDFVSDFFETDGDYASWIVTNPPFNAGLGEKFALRALDLAPNVALLCRLSWLEGAGRYSRLFAHRPPSQVLVFTERVGFNPGTCVVDGKGMVQYAWYVWQDGQKGTQLKWIPPGWKTELTMEDDEEKYGKDVIR